MTAINHVGMTVPDLEQGIAWYTEVFGLTLLAGPIQCDLSTRGADRRKQIFGEQWGVMRIAHLGADNRAGIELFQFLEPETTTPDDPFPFASVGLHHVAITVDDFEGTLERILARGGTKRCTPSEIYGGVLVCYTQDPWGNVVEVTNADYPRLADATTVTSATE